MLGVHVDTRTPALMTENRDLRSRLVIGQKRDGRREYDDDAREELVRLCLKPGISVARMAMEHDVNPNLLRTWVTRYQQKQAVDGRFAHASEVSDDGPIDVTARTATIEPRTRSLNGSSSASAASGAILSR